MGVDALIEQAPDHATAPPIRVASSTTTMSSTRASTPGAARRDRRSTLPGPSPTPPDRTELVGIDVVILDLQFQEGRAGSGVVRRIAALGHPVVVYTMTTDTATVLTCLDLGRGVLPHQGRGPSASGRGDSAAAANIAYIGPTMAGAIADDRRAERPVLSPREQEVLMHWFRTESKQLVATALYITPATVNTHLARVRTKYAAAGRPANTKAALIARALQDGLVTLDDL